MYLTAEAFFWLVGRVCLDPVSDLNWEHFGQKQPLLG